MYETLSELLALSNSRNVPMWRIVLENEQELSGYDEEQVFAHLDRHYNVMLHSAECALEESLTTAGGLIEGIASVQYSHAKSGGLCGEFLNVVMARALSCSEANAAMGKICAAPTAGACGILPAVLSSVADKYALPRRNILEALLTASGVGAVIMKNATVSGAEGGCQAECGAAAAMAAAAAVQLAGGSVAAALHACSFALMNSMGLICDPIAGLVQIPCAMRNASQAVNAMLSADLALGGMESPVPADEAIEAMYNVGRKLPVELKETALGGIAATPSAKAVERRIFG